MLALKLDAYFSTLGHIFALRFCRFAFVIAIRVAGVLEKRVHVLPPALAIFNQGLIHHAMSRQDVLFEHALETLRTHNFPPTDIPEGEKTCKTLTKISNMLKNSN